ncbi:MAG: ABC-three component system middle component 2 [Xanthobacteraceae bacterium]|uniref:ABC-three component system middle component 2 n=1 Tax=Pseudolabrys sp. TaxID=1960880 RepID=UPI003D0C26B9
MTDSRPATFNGPLEAGVRAVAILAAAYPRSFDLQRLVAMDYLLVHTGDIGGPASLHPPTPLQSAALLVRRKLVEQALLLMMTRDLVTRKTDNDGIMYGAGENAAPFLDGLEAEYLVALRERAEWLVHRLGNLTEHAFRGLMRQFFDHWVEEFQSIEKSLGSEQ